MKNKGGLLSMVILVIVLLIIGFFVFCYFNKEEINGEKECADDEDCVKQQISCCSCSMGGEEKCIPKSEIENYTKKLENCSKGLFCIAMFNCKIESCKCVKGKCEAVIE